MFSPIGVKQLIEYFKKHKITFKNIVAFLRVFATFDITHTFDCSLRDFNSKCYLEKEKWKTNHEEKFNSKPTRHLDLFHEVHAQLKRELQYDHHRREPLNLADTKLVSKLMNFIKEVKTINREDIISLDFQYKFVYLEEDMSGNMRFFQCYSQMFNYMQQVGMIKGTRQEKMDEMLKSINNDHFSICWADDIEKDDGDMSFLDEIMSQFKPLSQGQIESLFNDSKAIDRYATKSPVRKLIEKNNQLYDEWKEGTCLPSPISVMD